MIFTFLVFAQERDFCTRFPGYSESCDILSRYAESRAVVRFMWRRCVCYYVFITSSRWIISTSFAVLYFGTSIPDSTITPSFSNICSDNFRSLSCLTYILTPVDLLCPSPPVLPPRMPLPSMMKVSAGSHTSLAYFKCKFDGNVLDRYIVPL